MEEKKDKKEAIEGLLIRYCQGLTTPEECNEVEQWIDQSEENLRLAKQVYLIHRTTSDMEILQEIDTEKALKKVTRSFKPLLWKVWLHRIEKVAAILFLPLLCAYLVQMFGKSDENIQEMLEVRTKAGHITRITLPDSTVVFLNSRSTLCYPHKFRDGNREVTLKGEGYFEVTHNESSPFIVNLSQGLQIEVLGTTFNIEAYEDQPFASTTLVEGHVNFLYNKEGGKKVLSMAPDHKVLFDKNKENVSYYQVDSRTETAWKDGKIIFNNTPILEAIHQLEKSFNVSIGLRNENLKEYSFTGTFDEQALEPILESFKIASKIHWREIGTDTLTHKKQIELFTNSLK